MKNRIASLMAVIAFCCGFSAMAQEDLLGGNFKGWIQFIDAKYKKAGAAVQYPADGSAVVTTKTVTPSNYTSIQLIRNLDLEKGKKYKLTFDLATNAAGKLDIVYIVSKAPWTTYAKNTFSVSPDQTSYECVLEPQSQGELGSPRSLRFFAGAMPDATITISNIKLVPVE